MSERSTLTRGNYFQNGGQNENCSTCISGHNF